MKYQKSLYVFFWEILQNPIKKKEINTSFMIKKKEKEEKEEKEHHLNHLQKEDLEIFFQLSSQGNFFEGKKKLSKKDW